MLLSKLVYRCVKNTVYYDEKTFNYEQFLQGKFDSDSDYSVAINNVFDPINEALARLNDLERIPYCVDTISITYDSISVYSLTKPLKEIMAVAIERTTQNTLLNTTTTTFKPIPYKLLADRILVPVSNCKVAIEYKQDLPVFDEDSYKYTYVESLEGLQLESYTDVELKDYGINDSMCNYIIEYVKGQLSEPISPNIANLHLIRAEQYFNNIRPAISGLRQTQVVKINEMERDY